MDKNRTSRSEYLTRVMEGMVKGDTCVLYETERFNAVVAEATRLNRESLLRGEIKDGETRYNVIRKPDSIHIECLK